MTLNKRSALAVMMTVATAMSGCGTRDPAADPSAATPSAPLIATVRVVDGVRLIEHPADAFARAPRFVIDTVPLATMGGSRADPDLDLTYAMQMVLLSSGSVAAMTFMPARLLTFTADGRGHAWGREGKGPGEFMAPSGLVRTRGDTIIIPDQANGRINWATVEAGVVAQAPLTSQSKYPFLEPVGVLPDGRIVGSPSGWIQNAKVMDSVVRPPVAVVVMGGRGERAVEVATVPGMETVLIATNYRGRPGTTSTVVRLGQAAHIAVWDSLIVTAIGDGYTIDCRDTTGTVVARLRVPVARRAVTQVMRDAMIALELSRTFSGPHEGGGMVDSAETRREIVQAPFADSLPPYGGLFVSPNHTLWVTDAYAFSDSGWDATAFRPDGAIIGRLHVDGKSHPMSFGDDRVLVRGEDADGMVTLRVYRIVPDAVRR